MKQNENCITVLNTESSINAVILQFLLVPDRAKKGSEDAGAGDLLDRKERFMLYWSKDGEG